MVRVSLVDDEANVRPAAAKAFDVLQEHLGAKAIDQTIPTLLAALRQPGKGSGTALHALREVMGVSSDGHDHLLSLIFVTGSCHDCVPGSHSDLDGGSDDGLQLPGFVLSRYRRWKCIESTTNCDFKCPCQDFRGWSRRGTEVSRGRSIERDLQVG